jgi:hypothetical protein
MNIESSDIKEASDCVEEALTDVNPNEFRSRKVDPKDLDFELLDENVKHPSAPPMKKKSYVKDRCECKRLVLTIYILFSCCDNLCSSMMKKLPAFKGKPQTALDTIHLQLI